MSIKEVRLKSLFGTSRIGSLSKKTISLIPIMEWFSLSWKLIGRAVHFQWSQEESACDKWQPCLKWMSIMANCFSLSWFSASSCPLSWLCIGSWHILHQIIKCGDNDQLLSLTLVIYRRNLGDVKTRQWGNNYKDTRSVPTHLAAQLC